jgi:hypothetical protein
LLPISYVHHSQGAYVGGGFVAHQIDHHPPLSAQPAAAPQ